MTPLVVILVVLLVLSFGWGQWGYARTGSAMPWVGGWSPLGVLLVLVLVLALTGHLR